jgi:cell filamentation protein, protein adenylyltransferase
LGRTFSGKNSSGFASSPYDLRQTPMYVNQTTNIDPKMSTEIPNPLQSTIARADELKSQLDALRPLAPDIEGRVLQKLRLWWNYNSNAIEGNKYTLGETESVLMHGLTAKGKPLKDYLDIEGHEEAVAYLLGLIRQQEVLTEASIRKLHELLLVKPYEVDAETPDGKPTKKLVQIGEYKTTPNHVRTRTGEIHYYAAPMEVPPLMQELVTWYRSELNGKMHPIELAARFHHRFTAIHPFDDGNGRLGRLLMNLTLMQRNFPPAVIQFRQRDDYLIALQEADNGDPNKIIEMLADAVSASLDVYLRAARGEQIHDLQDLSKEISLFKQSLRHVPDPTVLSTTTQRALFKSTIIPLYQQTALVLSELLEVFREGLINLSYSSRQGNTGRNESIHIPLDANPTLNSITNLIVNDTVITQLAIIYTLRGFKRGGLNTFDVGAQLTIRFLEMQYSLNWSPPTGKLDFLYDHPMSKDAMDGVTEAIVRQALETIRGHTK